MTKKKRIHPLDLLLLALTILPMAAGIVLNVLTKPLGDGVEITGARIFLTIPFPIQDLIITESQINSWLILLSILGLCLFLTRGLSVRPQKKRQLVAEWIVETTKKLVNGNMGERFRNFAPFVAAIMALSAFSSLSSLLGMFPPTSDLNVVAGWAILVFMLITYYKLRGGLGHYLKGFLDPVPIFAPFNIIGEIATPVSMAFRHYGNVLSGTVIAALVAYGLQNLSSLLLHWLPGVLGEIPFLQIGLPAVLSVYFDVFSGCLQAFIFAMLTMLYISNGYPEEAAENRAKHKKRKQEVHSND